MELALLFLAVFAICIFICFAIIKWSDSHDIKIVEDPIKNEIGRHIANMNDKQANQLLNEIEAGIYDDGAFK
ncbi:MAG: hypothetical protein GY782_11830 [Gammaproteobacteria bacterium]|nr:hypothetical protein [Gammaproteobacteria bacterium]